MEVNYCKDIIYQRPWGKHKNGFFKMTYNSGSYALMQKIQNDTVLEQRYVEVKTKNGYYDVDVYAVEHGFVRL